MGADERDGISAFAVEVSARPEELRTFFDNGRAYVGNLAQVFDGVVRARRATAWEMGGDASLPLPLAAKGDYSGIADPFAETILEAEYNNRFVQGVHDALLTHTTADGVATASTYSVNQALAAVGLSTSGQDLSLGDDRARLDEIDRLAEKAEVRADLETVLADNIDGSEPYTEWEALGIGIQNYILTLDGTDAERQALVAEVMLEYGIELQAGLDPESEDFYYYQSAALLLTTQGMRVFPNSLTGELVDRLATERVALPGGGTRPALDLLVDALDPDQAVSVFSATAVGPSHHDFAGDNQPYFRQQALDKLINATLDADGAISSGGQHLVDYILDTYPGVVELSDDSRRLTVGTRWDLPTDFDLRATLATALAAPNYGLSEAEYDAAVRIDEIDAQLADPDSLSQAEFDELWLERRVRVSELAGHDESTKQLITDAMVRGLPAADAARLSVFAAEADGTNDRVRRIRVVYETNSFGQPVAPADLDRLDVSDAIAQSLMVELTVLQTVQEARFAEGKPVPDVPLTPEQISLVFEYSQYSAWVHHSRGGSFLGHEEIINQLASGEDAGFHGVPPGLAELAVELSKPENAIIWELMPGASGNDTFLGPNGTYRVDGGRDHILSDDAQALAIQMILLSKIGPHHADLAYGNDNIHEDEVDRWLDENRDNPDVPPALIDLVETGRSFGLGEDTFGWEEFGEIIGWVGLAAAITATIVYSGGTAAPLWVQAGLVGLAGLEAFAFIQADDPFDAALAGLGGAADLLTAARLIRRARSAATYASGPDAGRILGETKDELVQLASNSTIRDLQVLAAEADGLTPTEFLARYAEVVADNKGQIARDLVASGQSPAEAARIVDEIQLPAGSTDAFGYADAEQLRLLNDPARRPTTQIRTDGQGRQVRIAHGDRAGEYVTVINSRNVEDGYVTLADGTRVEFDGDGFPVLDSRYDTIIDDKHLGTANEAQHFAAANENLYNAILRDPSLVETMGLRDDQLAHIWPKADGTFRTKPPDDLTWHHHQDTGRMQLVDRIDHASIRHTGGMRIWGGGRD